MSAANLVMSHDESNDSTESCRFCSKKNEQLISVYSEEALHYDIPKKIEMYLPIKMLQLGEFSSKSCLDCVAIIISWHNFVQKVIKVNEKLETAKEKIDALTEDLQNADEGDTPVPIKTSLFAFCQDPKKDILKNENSGEGEHNQETNIGEDVLNLDDCHDINEDLGKNNIKHDLTPGDISYVCHFCPQIFSSEEEVLNHTNDMHPEITDVEEPPTKSRGKTKKIRTKIDRKIINEAKVVVDDRVYYNCKECGKSLLSPYTYIWHMRIHTGERPFVCDLCGKQFRVTQGLMRHLKETHERIKNFPCDICGRMFATRRNVDEHRRIHTNERPYVCALCGKAFKQKASLFVHNRTHSDTFPYKCDYCSQGFRAKPPLLIHLTKHTGQKPYPCDICGRCFRIKYELKRHKLVHSEEKPFSCSMCGMRFKQKRYLVNHYRANHMNKN